MCYVFMCSYVFLLVLIYALFGCYNSECMMLLHNASYSFSLFSYQFHASENLQKWVNQILDPQDYSHAKFIYCMPFIPLSFTFFLFLGFFSFASFFPYFTPYAICVQTISFRLALHVRIQKLDSSFACLDQKSDHWSMKMGDYGSLTLTPINSLQKGKLRHEYQYPIPIMLDFLSLVIYTYIYML